MLQSMGSQRVRHDLATEEQEVRDGTETDMNDMFRSRKGCLSRGNSLCKGPGARGGTLAYSGKSQKVDVTGM